MSEPEHIPERLNPGTFVPKPTPEPLYLAGLSVQCGYVNFSLVCE